MQVNHFSRFKCIALVTLSWPLAVQATVIYRWVDKSGHTHISDVVPDKYKKSAKPIDSTQFEISAERKKLAEEQAFRLKEDANKSPAALPNVAASAPPAAPSDGELPKRPNRGVSASTDCETWRRLYQESLDCFGPYRTVNGGIKPEAFERCTEIPSPDHKCGPQRN